MPLAVVSRYGQRLVVGAEDDGLLLTRLDQLQPGFTASQISGQRNDEGGQQIAQHLTLDLQRQVLDRCPTVEERLPVLFRHGGDQHIILIDLQVDDPFLTQQYIDFHIGTGR